MIKNIKRGLLKNGKETVLLNSAVSFYRSGNNYLKQNLGDENIQKEINTIRVY